jgi:hypothetical protein
MANYYGSARSNYFRVKDGEAFKKWAASLGLDVLESSQKRGGEPQYAMTPIGTDDGGWPSWRFEDENGQAVDEELDLAQELSRHLHDDDVVVLMESGAEKLRYVSGWAVAVNSKGDRVQLTLSDIYEAAKHLGTNITEATY